MLNVRPELRSSARAAALLGIAILGISIVLASQPKSPRPRSAERRFAGATTIIPMSSLLPAPRLASRVRVAVIRDPAAAEYQGEAALDTIVRAWERTLLAVGADARIVTPGALADMSYQVLVVPSSPCLSLATRAAIERAGALGQGVIATGRVGTYDARCRPIGYGLVVSLSGARRADTLEKRGMVYVRFSRNAPLATGIPPGARVELDPAGYVALRQPGRDAYYSDFTLEPRPAGEQPLLDGAVAHAALGRGRAVYWGFELTDAVQLPWNSLVLAYLVRNSVAWAAKHILLQVEPWPGGLTAAAALAQDVEDQFTNARHALDSLRAARVPATYFLTSNLARRHRSLTAQLAAHGEIGTHSENHRLLGGGAPKVQAGRLALTQRHLTGLLGQPVRGLRPPEEQFDVATMSGWLKAGGSYIFGANNSRSAAPELLDIGGDTIVLLGRVNTDDFGSMSLAWGGSLDAITRAYVHEFENVRALGGLYLLSYHSQFFARPELVPVVARLARRLAADREIWLATTGDVADWWRARARLHVRAELPGNGRLLLRVVNRNPNAMQGAVVRIVLPGSSRAVNTRTRILPSQPGVLRMALPRLKARETRVFSFALVPSASTSAR
jgi:peptidoglycan/xylan/chitin deacetylase (PgdA/CDA1 family)